MVPSDYEFLAPERPAIRYESDLSPEEKKRMKPALDAMHERAKQGIRLGPPWTINLESGKQFVIGADGKIQTDDDDDPALQSDGARSVARKCL
jgi:hypothetical protein